MKTKPAQKRRCNHCGKVVVERPQERDAVITVRMPESLHAKLKAQAHKAGVSLNEFCIDRLIAKEAIG